MNNLLELVEVKIRKRFGHALRCCNDSVELSAMLSSLMPKSHIAWDTQVVRDRLEWWLVVPSKHVGWDRKTYNKWLKNEAGLTIAFSAGLVDGSAVPVLGEQLIFLDECLEAVRCYVRAVEEVRECTDVTSLSGKSLIKHDLADLLLLSYIGLLEPALKWSKVKNLYYLMQDRSVLRQSSPPARPEYIRLENWAPLYRPNVFKRRLWKNSHILANRLEVAQVYGSSFRLCEPLNPIGINDTLKDWKACLESSQTRWNFNGTRGQELSDLTDVMCEGSRLVDELGFSLDTCTLKMPKGSASYGYSRAEGGSTACMQQFLSAVTSNQVISCGLEVETVEQHVINQQIDYSVTVSWPLVRSGETWTKLGPGRFTVETSAVWRSYRMLEMLTVPDCAAASADCALGAAHVDKARELDQYDGWIVLSRGVDIEDVSVPIDDGYIMVETGYMPPDVEVIRVGGAHIEIPIRYNFLEQRMDQRRYCTINEDERLLVADRLISVYSELHHSDDTYRGESLALEAMKWLYDEETPWWVPNTDIYGGDQWGYVRDLLQDLCAQPRCQGKAQVVLEPFKARIITVLDGVTQELMRPVQQALWQRLADDPRFAAIGTGGNMSDAFFPESWRRSRNPTRFGRHYYVSVDYKSSTDYLSMDLTLCIWSRICDRLNVAPYVRAAGVMLLSSCDLSMSYRGDSLRTVVFPQRNGQLMGCIISFPILCLANAAIIQTALKSCSEAPEYRINGDDAAFYGTNDSYDAWIRYVRAAGMKVSPGKNYTNREMILMSSRVMLSRDLNGHSRWYELPYINVGVLHNRGRVLSDERDPLITGNTGYSIGQNCAWLLRLYYGERARAIRQHFIAVNRERLVGKPYYIPEVMGGHGLPLVGDETYFTMEKDPRTRTFLTLMSNCGPRGRAKIIRSLRPKRTRAPWLEAMQKLQKRVGASVDNGPGFEPLCYALQPNVVSEYMQQLKAQAKIDRRNHVPQTRMTQYKSLWSLVLPWRRRRSDCNGLDLPIMREVVWGGKLPHPACF